MAADASGGGVAEDLGGGCRVGGADLELDAAITVDRNDAAAVVVDDRALDAERSQLGLSNLRLADAAERAG